LRKHIGNTQSTWADSVGLRVPRGLSARTMQLLGRHSAWVEVYSIDEAFLGVRGTLPELQALARRMKQDVMDHLGLLVCVGIAKTTGTAEYSLVAYWGARRKRKKSYARGELSQVATGLQLANGSHPEPVRSGNLGQLKVSRKPVAYGTRYWTGYFS
jgi:hypothetical protein